MCPFGNVCDFANAENPEADDLILREVFCETRPNACAIFKRILENGEVLTGMRPHGCIRKYPNSSHAKVLAYQDIRGVSGNHRE